MDKRSLRKMFPNLTKELENGDAKINIDSVRTGTDSVETALADKFLNYNPTVIDFIRRCDTEAQAESIIAFMEARRELDKEHAQQIRHQLRQEGVRSFGPKKEDYYYFKQSRFC
jgi:hypothetical protein